MELGLKDKVALVAGSSQGLGRAVAEELASEGAKLVLCARTESTLRKTLDQISQRYGCRAIAVPTDLKEPRQVERLHSAARRELGPIQILVNNAGGPPAGTFADLTPESWEEAFKLTLNSAVSLTRLVLPDMRKTAWGRVINITSIAVKQPVDNLILSNSLRAAVTGFARTLANEVAPFGITVNNVLPGFTRTRRLNELIEQLARKQQLKKKEIVEGWEAGIPMRRLGTPRELAALVAFLASERASYITGTSITVDGGWVRSLL